MISNIGDVLSVYKKTGGLLDETSGASATPSGGKDFGDMVKDFLGDTVSTLRESEAKSAAAAAGKTDLASVVTAMNNAEIALTEITTIRDKVISAYQSITSGTI